MMRLHDNLSSGNGYKARLLLAQLGLPYERVEYDIDRGETRTAGFLEKVNANGRVPVLETDAGELLPESGAILFYLAEGTPFLPEGRLERARVLQWMFFEQYSHEPKRERGYAALEVMESHLEDHDFFVAGRYSIADIALYAYTHVADEGGFDLDGFPAVRAWIERVRSQPAHIPITRG